MKDFMIVQDTHCTALVFQTLLPHAKTIFKLFYLMIEI